MGQKYVNRKIDRWIEREKERKRAIEIGKER